MTDPRIGQTIRFTDKFNGARCVGVVERHNIHSHYDSPVWDVWVVERNEVKIPRSEHPLWAVERGEIDEVIDPCYQCLEEDE